MEEQKGKPGEDREEKRRRKVRSDRSTTRFPVPKSRWTDLEATSEGPGPAALMWVSSQVWDPGVNSQTH